jgi:predicted Zn finger-like uncharacterized protein
MILTCPACHKKYLIPDTAIGAEGRQVRCAACRHSWFELLPEQALVADQHDQMERVGPAVVPDAAERRAPQPPPAPEARPATPPNWSSPAPDAAPAAVTSAHADDIVASDYDPYAHEAPFRPHRNPTRRWTIAAVVVSLMLFAGLGAVYYFATPNFLARLGIPIGEIDTPLITQFTSDRGPKEGMPATAPFVIIHGQIINPTDQAQRVPDIIAELLDSHGRVVYSWTITPSRRTVAPKATLPIDDTAVNIPHNAQETRLTFSGVDPK